MSEPLVLLPGMMCDARLFAPQIAALSAGRTIAVCDLSRDASVPAMAARMLDEAPERFALAGLSMGGIVAMEVFEQAPERVARLALLDTNPRAELPEVAARRGPQMAAAREGRLRAVMVEEMKPNYLVDGPGKPALMELCLEMALALGPDAFLRQSVALRDRADRQDTLRRVDVPALVLCGREDRLCPVERHELMHSLIPGSRLVVIDGAAHMPTLERPEETTAALARWLED